MAQRQVSKRLELMWFLPDTILDSANRTKREFYKNSRYSNIVFGDPIPLQIYDGVGQGYMDVTYVETYDPAEERRRYESSMSGMKVFYYCCAGFVLLIGLLMLFICWTECQDFPAMAVFLGLIGIGCLGFGAWFAYMAHEMI